MWYPVRAMTHGDGREEMAKSIEDAQKRLADELMSRGGISGVGIGSHGGRPCLNVYASGKKTGKIPKRFKGHPVRVIEGGPFRALDARPADGSRRGGRG